MPDSVCNGRSILRGRNVDMISVNEWLKNLGLSRYEDIFIQEEVDLESLQWLTEEVLLHQKFNLHDYYLPPLVFPSFFSTLFMSQNIA
jgi:SAM domain (Sterile alpha motif)